MVTELLDCISAALYDKFGPGIEIYTNVVEMGSAENCFFLQVLEPALTRYPNRRWRLEVPLDVHYFQGDGTDTTALYGIGERALPLLEQLPNPGGLPFRGTGLRFQVDEGERALHVFATYTLQLRDVEETELMQILSQEVGLSG